MLFGKETVFSLQKKKQHSIGFPNFKSTFYFILINTVIA